MDTDFLSMSGRVVINLAGSSVSFTDLRVIYQSFDKLRGTFNMAGSRFGVLQTQVLSCFRNEGYNESGIMKWGKKEDPRAKPINIKTFIVMFIGFPIS